MSYYPRDRLPNLRMLLCKQIKDVCGDMCSDILCSFGILRSDSTSKTDSMHEINIELISIAVAMAVVLK